MAEEARGEGGDGLAAFAGRGLTVGHHRGRGADVDQVRRGAALFQPTDEHGHVCALPAAIGVQLVEDQEADTAGAAVEKALVLGPHQHQLQHDVVGQHQVGRVLAHQLARVVARLAGVARKGDGEGLAGAALVVRLERFQRQHLRVDQRVHRIDHQRRRARLGRPAQQRVDDGQEVGEALAGAGAAGDDVALPVAGFLQGLALVPVEDEGSAIGPAEDARRLRVDDAAARQVVHALVALVGGADLQERIGPQVGLLGQGAVHELLQPRVGHMDERGHEVAVIGQNGGVEVEDGHRRTLQVIPIASEWDSRFCRAARSTRG